MKNFIKILIFLLLLFIASCATRKDTVVTIPVYTRHADTCLTDKQYKRYLKFVIDSMKIESKNQKIEYRFDNARFKDSLNAVKKMYERQLTAATKQHKETTSLEKVQVKEENKTERNSDKQATKQNRQNNQTARTEIRQTEKTKRYKWWVWYLFGFGSCFVVMKVPFKKIFQFIVKLIIRPI